MPHRLTKKIFRGSRAIKKGLLTRAELRSSAWRRLFRDVYADATLNDSHELRCTASGAFLLPEGAAIAGRSAAHLHGGLALRSDEPVEVLTPKDFGPVSGLAIHRGQVGAADTTREGRLLVTTPLRTCWDLARWLDLTAAVAAIDALLKCQSLDPLQLQDFALRHAGEAGYSKVLRVAGLADGASESPQESRLRVGLVLAGLPKPVSQHVITLDGRFVALVDLAWPELRIAVEYDGRWHASTSQLEHDRARLNRLLGADWVVFHVTADQLRHNLPSLVAEIRAAMRSRERVARW
jgi:very-short-patch-repair endonuclease